jgi:hypothetical protein
MQKSVLNFLMNTQGPSSLFEYPLFRRNYFSRLCHILPNCFTPYKNLTNFKQYMLRFAFVFGTKILSVIFMYMSEFNDSYKYAITTSINSKDRCFCIARDIRYHFSEHLSFLKRVKLGLNCLFPFVPIRAFLTLCHGLRIWII